jgi:glycosyltransferase involved in cell wall biosynthesis
LLSIARDVWHLPLARLFCIPNGVNCERFRVARHPQFLARFGVTGDLPVIGTVAALRSEKNLFRLIDAFAGVLQRRRAQLVIVGDGPERSRLHAHALASGIGDQVFFTGAQAEPEKFLACFDVFALTSDTEQMPLSVLEAMAASLPLVATDVGDIRHMIAKENIRFLVKPNIEALAEAMLTVVNDQALATALGAANAQRVADLFSENRMFIAYGNLFDGPDATASHPSNHATINHNTAT